MEGKRQTDVHIYKVSRKVGGKGNAGAGRPYASYGVLGMRREVSVPMMFDSFSSS